MIPWSQYDYLLGTIPDKELAERIGTTEGNVRTRRCRKGISVYSPAAIVIPPPAPVYDPPLRLVLREDGKAIEREIVTPDGTRHLVVAQEPEFEYVTGNGTIYDSRTHRITKGAPGGGTHALTTDKSNANRQIRQEKAEIMARQALASKSTRGNSYDGWKMVVSAQVDQALKPDSPYSTNAAKFVGSAAGLLRDRREAEKSEGVTIDISADVARMMIDKLRQRDV